MVFQVWTLQEKAMTNMVILVVNEIFRRIAAEIARIESELSMLRWYQLLRRRALWAKKRTFQRKQDALQNEQWLLEQGNSPDPCVLVLGEIYRPGNKYQEDHIKLWING
jgi:hypothetical protein